MRKILTARVADHEHLMRGMPGDLVDLDIARRACRNAWAWRNEWSVAHAANRDCGARLSKDDADLKLRSLLRDQCNGRCA
jgi:hypothetical protein